ncbi:MAG: Gfo/Idh/MocA family oxidoreductase [Limisphaerales bacterium]
MTPQDPKGQYSRRNFLKTTGAAAAGGSILIPLAGCRTPEKKTTLATVATAAAATPVFAQHTDTLKIALIGCGGRGTGACGQALNTEGPVKLVAMADVFKDRLDSAYNTLKDEVTKRNQAERVDVPEENKFVGFDAYKKAIALADVVILATPPGFRPMTFEEAVKQGKNIFMEKPVAVDAPGIRKVLAAAQEAKAKNLKVGVGLQRHHQLGYIDSLKRIHDGAIGDVVAMRAYWNGNTPWVHPRAKLEEEAGRKLTEMEYRMRNWYYFVWICGDHIVEQHIHNLDVINWIKGGHPVKARGNGGCETRKGKDYGEIFDHHVVEFEYADGSVCFSQCRHQQGCWNDVSEHAIGTKGKANLTDGRWTITGAEKWSHKQHQGREKYQQEHDDLFAAIRSNTPYNEVEYGAHSTMTSILGRMATYSGKEIDWDAAIASNIDTMPKTLAWDAETPTKPGPDGMYQLAIPGQTVTV